MTGAKPRIAICMINLGAGGAEMSMLNLAGGLIDRGYPVDLVLCEAKGPLQKRVPEGVRVAELAKTPILLARLLVALADPAGIPVLARPLLLPRSAPHRLGSLWGLVRYLRTAQPSGLITALRTPNMMGVWARRLAGSSTRLIVSQRNSLSDTLADGSDKWRKRFLPDAITRSYAMADEIVAVSDGVADDLAAHTGLERSQITTVYNPVVDRRLITQAAEPSGHPWLDNKNEPVVLAVGALIAQKDHDTLIRAFAQVRAERACKLVIVGAAKSTEQDRTARERLTALATELGVVDDFDLAGFQANPFAFMARADLFVLASRFEGLPGVLVQALACGATVVATDCPHGPREILRDGRDGELVPVGDQEAMAVAMTKALEAPRDPQAQRRRGADFSVSRATDHYLKLLFGEAPVQRPAAERVPEAVA